MLKRAEKRSRAVLERLDTILGESGGKVYRVLCVGYGWGARFVGLAQYKIKVDRHFLDKVSRSGSPFVAWEKARDHARCVSTVLG